jgi:hypothetical protein
VQLRAHEEPEERYSRDNVLTVQTVYRDIVITTDRNKRSFKTSKKVPEKIAEKGKKGRFFQEKGRFFHGIVASKQEV